MLTARPPAVAGSFYSDDARSLRAEIDGWLDSDVSTKAQPKAIIVPHAGYCYSGKVAAIAYGRLLPYRETIRRVVMFGPAHRVPITGLATTSADVFSTPLGDVQIDDSARRIALTLRQVSVDDDAHAEEHCLEVQLPFLQRVLPHFQLLPFVIGRATPDEVAEVMSQQWGGPETLIVVSSDLSHYLDDESARQTDAESARIIESLNSDALTGRRACGHLAIRGLLTVAAARGLDVKTIALTNSGERSGDRSRVVGYGAFVVVQPDSIPGFAPLTDGERQELLRVAAVAIQVAGDSQRSELDIDLSTFPPSLTQRQAAFVTVYLDGRLQGCRGSITTTEPLVVNVARSARSAAFFDERFSPVRANDISRLEVHLSLLNDPAPIACDSEAELCRALRPGVDGLILREGSRVGLFLPSVWNKLPDPAAFVRHLKEKAGLPGDYWSDELKCERFTVEQCHGRVADLLSDQRPATGQPREDSHARH